MHFNFPPHIVPLMLYTCKQSLIASIPGQSELEGAKRGQLTVDGFMRVKGVADGSILAIGDAARVEGQR